MRAVERKQQQQPAGHLSILSKRHEEWTIWAHYRKQQSDQLHVPPRVCSCQGIFAVSAAPVRFIVLMSFQLFKFLFILLLIVLHFQNHWGLWRQEKKNDIDTISYQLAATKTAQTSWSKGSWFSSKFVYLVQTSECSERPLTIIVLMKERRTGTFIHKQQPQQK